MFSSFSLRDWANWVEAEFGLEVESGGWVSIQSGGWQSSIQSGIESGGWSMESGWTQF